MVVTVVKVAVLEVAVATVGSVVPEGGKDGTKVTGLGV